MKKYESYLLASLFSIFFLIGSLTFKDYGIGIEENFQRVSGFYWLKFLFDLSGIEFLKNLANTKIEEMYSLNPNLPSISDNLGYGVIFDLPSALIEIIFNFNNNVSNVYLKHFLSFLIFFVSAICFSCLLKKNFSNFYVTFFGTIIYFLSPRVYGASFFDGKDLFFFSIFTMSIYFYQKYEYKKILFNLIIFSLFAAFATSARAPGLMIPISFVLIYFFKILCGHEIKKNLNILFIFIFSYLVLLYLHWPFLWNFWENDYSKTFSDSNITFLFDGEYYKQKLLPISYIPKWILISTPLFITLLFFIGLFLNLKRFYIRAVSIKENFKKKYNFDFWRGEKEKVNFFILICFFQTIFIYLTFNTEITAAWRHFFFFHFFLSFFSSMSIYYIFIRLRKNKIIFLFYFVLIIFVSEMGYKLYVYHPYQNVYFNNLFSKNKKLKYEIDTAHLSRVDAIKEILLDSKGKNKIKLATASRTPLEDVLYVFSPEEIKKIVLIGNDDMEEADYIYTNYIYGININYNKKYEISKNFYLYKSIIKDGTLISSIFKKK